MAEERPLESKEIKQQASENVSRKSQERKEENLREKKREYLLMCPLQQEPNFFDILLK
ncbi:hypothetical protein K0M31_008006 [Melipona bicolor]|uniref:Uncharacterized protein n=1 Tax=Melipona bicolor TaxID=60889 RepID=A0AA40GCQ2_9HYME|nr:hypothetical protein K0M31_008006 [Melipona bicolor]